MNVRKITPQVYIDNVNVTDHIQFSGMTTSLHISTTELGWLLLKKSNQLKLEWNEDYREIFVYCLGDKYAHFDHVHVLQIKEKTTIKREKYETNQ